ncbi:tenascin-like isoform X2 [Ornithodoros turicata]|uniref:tenascin-like isoform X2 n=1 Tax=Ornithodoros turicata TaxID=34597 RepID=UPI00313868C5
MRCSWIPLLLGICLFCDSVSAGCKEDKCRKNCRNKHGNMLENAFCAQGQCRCVKYGDSCNIKQCRNHCRESVGYDDEARCESDQCFCRDDYSPQQPACYIESCKRECYQQHGSHGVASCSGNGCSCMHESHTPACNTMQCRIHCRQKVGYDDEARCQFGACSCGHDNGHLQRPCIESCKRDCREKFGSRGIRAIPSCSGNNCTCFVPLPCNKDDCTWSCKDALDDRFVGTCVENNCMCMETARSNTECEEERCLERCRQHRPGHKAVKAACKRGHCECFYRRVCDPKECRLMCAKIYRDDFVSSMCLPDDRCECSHY